MRILLVGESNPHGTDALHSDPEKGAGKLLRQKILGLTTETYLKAFDRVNLCAHVWDLDAARRKADRLLADSSHETFVLLGRRVARAFRFDGEAFTTEKLADRVLASLPHPSGRCHVWNNPQSVHKARALLKKLAPEIPWGERHDRQDGPAARLQG